MTDQPDELERARARLAETAPDDYVIAPQDHTRQFQDVPTLVQLLETSVIRGMAASFTKVDARANANRDTYLSSAQRANSLVLASAILGALITASIAIAGPMLDAGSTDDTAGPTLTNPWVAVFSIAAALVAGWSAFLLSRLNRGGFLQDWMVTRAEAEAGRLAYFEAITKPETLLNPLDEAPEAVHPKVQLIAFWYFLRFQLRVQLTYYEQRSADHRRAARFSYNLAAVAVAVGVICALLVPLLSVFMGKYAALLAVVTVGGTALGGFATTREGISQHQTNAIRYQKTADTLARLALDTDRVEAALRLGRADVLTAFVDAVHEQLALEQKQWLDTTGKSSVAIENLNHALKSATTKT